MRDVIASQKFLKNASILSLERSDLTPISRSGLGDILFIDINKYYHFFIIRNNIKI